VRVPDADLGYLAFGWMTMGQILSAPMIVIGVALLAHARLAGQPSGNRAEPVEVGASRNPRTDSPITRKKA
jgi:prolipoprotein diacylglyceryltransferase